MENNKMRYIKQSQAKVYNCKFQLYLQQLRIFLRFPCKFFIEWKTQNSHQSVKTQGMIDYIDGKVLFNQKLTLDVQMIHDDSKNSWIRKDSSVNVYLVTKSKPNFNQLAGRINIDLSLLCGDNPFKKPLVQSLTYSSTSADLKFSMNLKYSIRSKKQASQIDLMGFNDRLYLVKTHENTLNKSKSVDYLKNSNNIVSPVYQINHQESINQVQEVKPFHFPLSNLESFGHDVEAPQHLENTQDQFEIRMTLGGSKQITKQEYDLIIQNQAQGMKKSNLMIIPDIKKSTVQQNDSQFCTQSKKNSESDFVIDKKGNMKVKQTQLKKGGSQKKCQKRQNSPESDIDIVVDLSSKNIINNSNMKNSMNSSKSFSISKFRAQYESSQQNFNKVKSPKQSVTSVQMVSGFGNFAQILPEDLQKQNHERKKECQVGKIRIKQLENDISELVKMLTDSKQKIQKYEKQNSAYVFKIRCLQQEKRTLSSKVRQLQEKYSYESKINTINCQKLKSVSSQLTLTKRRSLLSTDDPRIIQQLTTTKTKIQNLTEQMKKVEYQKASLQQKLYRRDEIQLQNEIRIQQLQEELQKYRSERLNNAPKISPSYLQIQSTIRKDVPQDFSNKQFQEKVKIQEEKNKLEEYSNFLQQKLRIFEEQNLKMKLTLNYYIKTLQIYCERDQRMKQNISIIEVQFKQTAKLLLQKEHLLKEKCLQLQSWRKKSICPNLKTSQNNQLYSIRLKQAQDQIKKKQELLHFCQHQINLLQQQLYKLQKQNKQLAQNYKKYYRDSLMFEGDLKVIKEQESYRQSLASSADNFFKNNFLVLTVRQQNIVSSYKEAVQTFYQKKNNKESEQVNFTIYHNDLKNKIFEELERSSKIMNEMLIDNQILSQQIIETKEQRQKIRNALQLKVNELQMKIDQFEENQRVSAGSVGKVPYPYNNNYLKPQEDKIDRFSHATKKRSPLNLNAEAQLNREVQKLKSIIYDKNKQMSDLIASYEKLKFEKETQSMLFKTNKVSIGPTTVSNIDNSDDTELVHDILDLQIKLNKQKEEKNQIMQELQLRKSLNKSQQVSQYIQQTKNFDLAQIYKDINQILKNRQNLCISEQSLNQLVNRINSAQQKLEIIQKDYKLIYLVQQKSRQISKQIQKLKSGVLKMTLKDIETMEYKSKFITILKPCQNSLNGLLKAVEEMVNSFI